MGVLGSELGWQIVRQVGRIFPGNIVKECGGAVEGEIEEIATTKEFVVLSTRKKGILSAENNGMLVTKWMDLPGPVHKQSETTRRGRVLGVLPRWP